MNQATTINLFWASLLGRIPSTAKYEALLQQQSSDFNRYTQLVQSEKITTYKALAEMVHSDAYQAKRKQINALTYKGSDEHKHEVEFKNLQRDKLLKNYFNVLEGTDLKWFKDFKNSEPYQKYVDLSNYSQTLNVAQLKQDIKEQKQAKKNELKQHKKSDPQEYKRLKEEMKLLTFENSEEYKTLQELKELKKNPEVKRSNKFQKSSAYKNFLKIQDSDKLKRYQELKEIVESPDFKERKAFLQAKDKFSLTEEYDSYKEYQELLKDKDVQWFITIEKEKPFGRFDELSLTFEDTFTSAGLDADKWLDLPYSGKITMNDTFSQATDEHFITKGENLEIRGEALRIITKQEKREGKAWHPTMGFLPKTFSATSGIVNTGESLLQQFGLVEAKVKVQKSAPVYHAFWLQGKQVTPHVEVFKFDLADTKSLHIHTYTGDMQNPSKVQVKVKGLDFGKDYFIFTLEWKKETLVWKVNGYTVYETGQGVPQIPMFVNLASGVLPKDKGQTLSGQNELAVDWIRVYQWN
jgi:hypothetical protein